MISAEEVMNLKVKVLKIYNFYFGHFSYDKVVISWICKICEQYYYHYVG
jgi:hypothetical protein